MKHANLLHWTLVFLWPGWRGSFAWYRWGILRGQHGGKAYLGPLEIIWGPRCPDTPPLCDGCHEPTLSLTRIDRTGGPDGEFCDGCVEMINEPECTCYELTGGHMPGCYFNRAPSEPFLSRYERYFRGEISYQELHRLGPYKRRPA